MVTLGRFELPTCGLGNRRSIHLSYRATPIAVYNGGAYGFPCSPLELAGNDRRLVATFFAISK
jgi:hypothetical protein